MRNQTTRYLWVNVQEFAQKKGSASGNSSTIKGQIYWNSTSKNVISRTLAPFKFSEKAQLQAGETVKCGHKSSA